MASCFNISGQTSWAPELEERERHGQHYCIADKAGKSTSLYVRTVNCYPPISIDCPDVESAITRTEPLNILV